MTTTAPDISRPELAKLTLIAAFGVLAVAGEAYVLGRRAGHRVGLEEAMDDEAIIRRAADRGVDAAQVEEAAQERIREAILDREAER
jgi:hypothetical protein